MATPTQQLLAFTWYHEADYHLLLQASRNHKGLAKDYKSWLKEARLALLQFKKLGFEPHLIYINVQDYLDWCALRQRPVNQPSREIYKEIKRQEFYRKLDAIEAGECPSSELDAGALEVVGIELVEDERSEQDSADHSRS